MLRSCCNKSFLQKDTGADLFINLNQSADPKILSGGNKQASLLCKSTAGAKDAAGPALHPLQTA